MMAAKSEAEKMKCENRIFNVRSLFVFTFALSLFHHRIDAAQTQIFSGPVSQGMGGGGRAGAESNELMFINPASLALLQGFDAGIIYRDGYWDKGYHESAGGIALMENDPENFAPGGFAYIYKRRTAPGLAWKEQIIFGAIAKSITPEFSMGLSVYHFTQTPEGGSKSTQLNGSVAALFTLSPTFGIAYVFANPARADEDLPVLMQLIPQQSLAANYVIPELLRLTLDVTRWERHNPDKKGIIQAGLELMSGDFGLFRIGAEFDDIEKRNSISLGLGFNGPKLKANYAITKPLLGTGGAMHSVDLRLPF